MPIVAACITFVGGIFIALLIHHLSKKRESIARHAVACSDFRAVIQTESIKIPPASQHWNNEVLASLPNVSIAFGLAVAAFSHHLSGGNRIRLESTWLDMKKHCEEEIPKALSASEVLYGGGIAVTQTVKETFHSHVKNLLSYAPQT